MEEVRSSSGSSTIRSCSTSLLDAGEELKDLPKKIAENDAEGAFLILEKCSGCYSDEVMKMMADRVRRKAQEVTAFITTGQIEVVVEKYAEKLGIPKPVVRQVMVFRLVFPQHQLSA